MNIYSSELQNIKSISGEMPFVQMKNPKMNAEAEAARATTISGSPKYARATATIVPIIEVIRFPVE